jgi:uncharacterized repeat protein (TIGR01451 family)
MIMGGQAGGRASRWPGGSLPDEGRSLPASGRSEKGPKMAGSGIRPKGGARRLGLTIVALVSLVLSGLVFAPAADAVHDLGLFELDRNAVDMAAAGDDWDTLDGGGGSAVEFTGILEDTSSPGTQFQAGGSKDNADITDWLWKTGEPLDKDDITNAYAAAYINQVDTGGNNVGDQILYYGLDRFANNGTAQVGFWFLQDEVGLTNTPRGGGFEFAGAHQVGDVLVQSNFSQGGVIDTISVFEWVGSGGSHGELNQLTAGQDCATSGLTDDAACATVNQGNTPAPWAFTPKFGTAGTFPQGSFFEGGINITRLVPDTGCFSTFMAETRTSNPFSARLKDFVLGSFELCDIDVDKTGDELGKVGDPVDYTITVENSGAVTLFKDDISDSLLGDITIDGVDEVNDHVTSNTCGASLAPGASCEITLTYTVQEGDPDPLPNEVTVHYTGKADLSDTGVSATDNHSVNLFQPSVAVEKSGDDLSKVGDDVDYTFAVTNTSSSDSPDLVNGSITDDVLGDLLDAANPFVTSSTCSATLPTGGSCTITATRTVQQGDPDPLDNVVTVLYNPEGFPNEITASDEHSVNLFQPAIAVDKTGDELSKVGDDVNYTITLSNNSSDDTPELTCTATDSLLGEIFSGTLPPAGVVLNETRTVQEGDADPLVNTVEVSCTIAGFANVLTASDSHTTELFQPAVEVLKSGPAEARVGETVTYEFTINNLSSDDAPNLILDSVTDTVLGDLTATAAANGCDSLAFESSCSFTADYTIQPGDPDPLENTVTVLYNPDGFPNEITDEDDHSVTIRRDRVQITPTGTECEDFLAETATDLATLEVNPSGNLAPGAFIHFTQLPVGPGQTTIDVSVRSDPDAAPDPVVNEAKLYTFDGSGNCTQISNQPGVTVTVAGNVATFQLTAEAAAQYGQVVTYTKYNSPKGELGTEFIFDTEVNGSLVVTDTLVVVDDV